MNHTTLTDKHNRVHNYLRISLTEKCNLRCTYCMPAEGAHLSPKENIMTADEVYSIAKSLVQLGVKKIRLTGGEPLVRKDFTNILKKLATLDVELSISSNGILTDRFYSFFKKVGLNKINFSIDSLSEKKFKEITRFNKLQKVLDNIDLALLEGFEVKLNVVLIKGFNDDEIIDLINFSKNRNLIVRFIEFMPFDGNAWKNEKVVSEKEILTAAEAHFGLTKIIRVTDAENDTAHNYRVKGYKGGFGIISTVTNPFCDSCNRIRLTANGKIKNCLFSTDEIDLLTALRQNTPLTTLISNSITSKHISRGGLDKNKSFLNPTSHVNRSMILIGG